MNTETKYCIPLTVTKAMNACGTAGIISRFLCQKRMEISVKNVEAVLRHAWADHYVYWPLDFWREARLTFDAGELLRRAREDMRELYLSTYCSGKDNIPDVAEQMVNVYNNLGDALHELHREGKFYA